MSDFMTTQEAADFLGMSRPHLVGLLEAGAIAHFMVGTHRRLRSADVENYAQARSLRNEGVKEAARANVPTQTATPESKT